MYWKSEYKIRQIIVKRKIYVVFMEKKFLRRNAINLILEMYGK
jgi:hypothetical protein